MFNCGLRSTATDFLWNAWNYIRSVYQSLQFRPISEPKNRHFNEKNEEHGSAWSGCFGFVGDSVWFGLAWEFSHPNSSKPPRRIRYLGSDLMISEFDRRRSWKTASIENSGLHTCGQRFRSRSRSQTWFDLLGSMFWRRGQNVSKSIFKLSVHLITISDIFLLILSQISREFPLFSNYTIIHQISIIFSFYCCCFPLFFWWESERKGEKIRIHFVNKRDNKHREQR